MLKQTDQLKSRPGIQAEMNEQPQSKSFNHRGSNKLAGQAALITGGDSGIGRAVAVAFAREGAQIAIGYLNEDVDAQETKRLVEEFGTACLTVKGDIGDPQFCKKMIQQVVDEYGSIDILVNNAGEQHPQEKLEDISPEQLERTFRTNIFSMFYLTQAALPHMDKVSTIINTASVTAYKGHPVLLDYSATKGAIVAFTRSLSLSLADKGIRVNAVAPGPIWTPLIPSTFDKKQTKEFGKDTPLGRPGQPDEAAAAFLFLASEDSSYITGQTIHVNGGTITSS